MLEHVIHESVIHNYTAIVMAMVVFPELSLIADLKS